MAAALGSSHPSISFCSDTPSTIAPPVEGITQCPWWGLFPVSESESNIFIPFHNTPTTHQTPAAPAKPTARTRRRSSTKSQVSYDNLSPERAKHLERNRVAANKCRLKKKREHEQIQNTLNNETARHTSLVSELTTLREEIWYLKNQIFDHAKCNDQRINLQLSKMTTQILGDNDMSQDQCPSPTFSVSTRSDGLPRENRVGLKGDQEGVLVIGADYGEPGMMFDSFIDMDDF